MNTLDEIAVAWIPCPYCSANAGDPCRVARVGAGTLGAPARYPHAPRLTAVMEAWRKGYAEGGRDTIATVVDWLRDRPGPVNLDELATHARRFLP